MLHFEDFTPGETRDFGSHLLTKGEILAFARRFDAQDFHTDEEAARQSFAGGLIGSGWHSCAIMMRLIAHGFVLGSTSRGGPGVDEVRWLRPVRPDDTVTLRRYVLEARASRSMPEMGLVKFRFELINQHGQSVMDQVNWIMFTRRGHDHPAAPVIALAPALYVPPAVTSPLVAPLQPGDTASPRARWFEDVEIGARREIGLHCFTAEEIIAFAAPFDPQPFHTDAVAARASAFGALCASGWHTAAAWMMLTVAARKRGATPASGAAQPRLGTSPGVRNIAWRKPVFAGDVLSYASITTDKRATASRPEWGLVFHRNSAVNQHGEEVFSFDGCVFWERKPA
jgi:acyl dehydratase